MCRKDVPARERYTRQRSSSISKKGVPYCSVEYTNFGGKLSGLSVCGKVAGDFGSLLGNNFGVMVTVGYNGRF